jgi:salicylate 5-hydroxylase large subunit
VVVRDRDGSINALVNRCAHRGLQFCNSDFGHASEFMCPYHQWTYTLSGALKAVPLRRGLRGQGGMPADFRLADHGLERLVVSERHGVIFASFDARVVALGDYLGPTMLALFDRVFDGRGCACSATCANASAATGS